MKTLILVRHAKATKSMFNIEDIDRPLIEKGIQDTYSMSHWLKMHKYIPDLIITSPAVRAYGTGMIMARILDYPVNNIKITYSLYEQGEEGYVDVLLSIKNEYKTVMLFAHNPDITNFVMSHCERFNEDIPTTGVIGLDLKIKAWEEIQDCKGTLKFFEFPK
jgi:phosphohistidine phosphatase